MIGITNLCKSFGENIVLKDLTITVKTGETKVVIGRSGVGKSVFLKNIVGILKPDSGSIKIDRKKRKKGDRREFRGRKQSVPAAVSGMFTFTSPVGFTLFTVLRID